MAERRQGQAAAGEISQGRAATYEHGEGAAAEVAADLFDGIKEMVVEYGMGSRKYMAINRWKRAREGLLRQGAVGTAAGNPELTGCFGTI